MKRPRNSAKAFVLRGGAVLALRKEDAHGRYYVLPGGGQRSGETLHQALRRECMEELGVAVRVGDLAFVREYIGAHHEFAQEHRERHQVEFIFRCEMDGDAVPAQGAEPDRRQVGVEWLALDRLEQYALYPAALRKLLSDGQDADAPVYLGDVN